MSRVLVFRTWALTTLIFHSYVLVRPLQIFPSKQVCTSIAAFEIFRVAWLGFIVFLQDRDFGKHGVMALGFGGRAACPSGVRACALAPKPSSLNSKPY